MIDLQEMAYLSTLYAQKHRHYHDITHIQNCLAELEQFNHPEFKMHQRNIVERAIWYHDAVYNPYSKLNEENSRDLLLARTDNISGFASIIIMRTKFHTETQSFAGFLTEQNLALATQVMLDIDLAGFGKNRVQYNRNGENIRAEYYNTTDQEYNSGRKAFLEQISKRDSLYYTDYFKQKYDLQSQLNLQLDLGEFK